MLDLDHVVPIRVLWRESFYLLYSCSPPPFLSLSPPLSGYGVGRYWGVSEASRLIKEMIKIGKLENWKIGKLENISWVWVGER
jgi:hypothetical protein